MKSKQPYASSIASLALLILVGCATQRTVIRKDGDPEIKVYGPDRIVAFGQTIPLENLDRAVRQHRLSEHENLQIMFYTDRRTDQPLMKAVTAELLQAKQKQFHLSRPRHATSIVKESQP